MDLCRDEDEDIEDRFAGDVLVSVMANPGAEGDGKPRVF